MMKTWFSCHFPDYPKLSRSGKILAWVMLLHALTALVGFGLIVAFTPWQPAVENGLLSAPLVRVMIHLGALILRFACVWLIFKYRIDGFRWLILLAFLELFSFQIFTADIGLKFDLFSSDLLQISNTIWGGFDGTAFSISINFAAIAWMYFAYKNFMLLKQDGQE